MSKHPPRKTRRPADQARARAARRPTSDRSIYLGLLIIGAGVVIVAWLLTHGAWWHPVALAYLAALALLMNLYAFNAYRGRPMANWKKALARLPLRFVGYGTRHGKPLSAAHNSARAKKATLVSVAVSVIVLALLVVAFYPDMLTG
jgi:hypothetical protein